MNGERSKLVPGRFTTAAIRIDGGELEVRLSDGGHWQVKAKMVEEDDWRSLCRGHLDGSIFDTAKPDRQAPFRVGPLLVDPAGRRVEVHGREVRLLGREFEVVALLATEPDRVFTKHELKRELWEDRGSFRTIDSHVKPRPVQAARRRRGRPRRQLPRPRLQAEGGGRGWSAMSRAVPAEQLPAVGSRGRLRRNVDRFPHFVAQAGATGIVTEATDSLIALRLDESLPGAAEWDNEVCWTTDDIGAPDQTVAAVFYEEVEITGRRQ